MQERKIKCPQCGRLAIYTLENSSRPFCSERCKLIDLGAWADESYKVPTPPNQEHMQENNTQELNSEKFNYGIGSDED